VAAVAAAAAAAAVAAAVAAAAAAVAAAAVAVAVAVAVVVVVAVKLISFNFFRHSGQLQSDIIAVRNTFLPMWFIASAHTFSL
jgi:membrane protein YdbS with pleckstrin-like domain